MNRLPVLMTVVVLLAGYLWGCGHKTSLNPPEPRRVEAVDNITATVSCSGVSLEWSPVFFDSRGNPLESSANYIVLRRRGAPVKFEKEDDQESNDDAAETTESIETTELAEATEPAETTELVDAMEPVDDILPMEYDFSLIAEVSGPEITLNDPEWSEARITWSDEGYQSGPVWSLQDRIYKTPDDFPPEPVEQGDSEAMALTSGYNYYYTVLAVDSRGVTSLNPQTVQVAWVYVPQSPLDVVGETGPGIVQLTWKTPELNCRREPLPASPARYEIQRGKQSTEETEPELEYLASTDQLSYEDSTVEVDSVYQYQVRAVLDPPGVPGEYSQLITMDTTDLYPPDVPVDLTGAVSMLGVHLNWRHTGSSDLAGYRVYRRTEPGTEFLLQNPDTLIRDNTYTDETVENGKMYEYRITAVDGSRGANESEPGNSWSVSIK